MSQNLASEVDKIPKPKSLDKSSRSRVSPRSTGATARSSSSSGFSFWQPSSSPVFLTEANLINVLRQVVVVSLLACGVTFVIILGQIDVSLGSVLALCRDHWRPAS